MISSTVFNPRSSVIQSPKLSLVALMDIFTILVFFLLLNSGEAQKIENAKFVHLPDSTKGQVPHEELMIMVNADEIWLGQEKLADVNDVLKGPEDIIEPLETELAAFKEKLGELTPFQEKNGLAVIIMGDKAVPYVLLKSVMATCRKQNFRNISLAVNRVVDSRKPAPFLPPTTGVESGADASTGGEG